MAKAPKKRKRNVESYAHTDKERTNNPPVGLVTPETDRDAGRKSYAHDPYIDPQLSWAGKAEHTSFETPTVSLHVHERIDPRTVVEAVRKRNGASSQGQGLQGSLFDAPEENPPIRQAIDFYRHRHNWTNRLVAGDSLLVMNSLLEKEGLGGQVQMVYVDPPYGIRYGSNFQPFVHRQDVTDGRDEDLTGEPETIRAFRDTWELGIHSYLTYLRDRLLLARELLHESGSCFVQIGKENVHRAGVVMDVGRRIKARLREAVGPRVTCSMGVASNRWLAKVASAMDKPDGLTVLDALPGRLLELDLEDLPGVGGRVRARLHRAGIDTVSALWAARPRALRAVWGSSGRPGRPGPGAQLQRHRGRGESEGDAVQGRGRAKTARGEAPRSSLGPFLGGGAEPWTAARRCPGRAAPSSSKVKPEGRRIPACRVASQGTVSRGRSGVRRWGTSRRMRGNGLYQGIWGWRGRNGRLARSGPQIHDIHGWGGRPRPGGTRRSQGASRREPTRWQDDDAPRIPGAGHEPSREPPAAA